MFSQTIILLNELKSLHKKKKITAVETKYGTAKTKKKKLQSLRNTNLSNIFHFQLKACMVGLKLLSHLIFHSKI